MAGRVRRHRRHLRRGDAGLRPSLDRRDSRPSPTGGQPAPRRSPRDIRTIDVPGRGERAAGADGRRPEGGVHRRENWSSVAGSSATTHQWTSRSWCRRSTWSRSCSPMSKSRPQRSHRWWRFSGTAVTTWPTDTTSSQRENSPTARAGSRRTSRERPGSRYAQGRPGRTTDRDRRTRRVGGRDRDLGQDDGATERVHLPAGRRRPRRARHRTPGRRRGPAPPGLSPPGVSRVPAR